MFIYSPVDNHLPIVLLLLKHIDIQSKTENMNTQKDSFH